MARYFYRQVLTPDERRTALIGAVLCERRFHAVDLSDCCFAYAACRDVLFEDVDLRGAQFRGAALERARFVRCDLTGASFAAAHVRLAQFIGCRGLSPRQAGSLVERHARICASRSTSADRHLHADDATTWRHPPGAARKSQD